MMAGRVTLEPMTVKMALDAICSLCSEPDAPRRHSFVAWTVGAVPRGIRNGDLVALRHDSVHARIGQRWERLHDFSMDTLPGEEFPADSVAMLMNCLIADIDNMSSALGRRGCRPDTLEKLEAARRALFEEEVHQAKNIS